MKQIYGIWNKNKQGIWMGGHVITISEPHDSEINIETNKFHGKLAERISRFATWWRSWIAFNTVRFGANKLDQGLGNGDVAGSIENLMEGS
jgi:hypothetical protein